MTQSGGHDPQTSERGGRADPRPGGTSAGADTTTRGDADAIRRDAAATTRGDVEQTSHRTDTHHTGRPAGAHETDRPLKLKTSAAAVFALVFGLAALFCALTAILSPFALVFGLLGIVLAIAGLKMSKRPGVTGKGVAIGGLVTALLGLVLGGAVLGGLAALVNDERRLDQLQTRIDELREKAPTTSELREELPSS